jgi:hypothetical protein
MAAAMLHKTHVQYFFPNATWTFSVTLLIDIATPFLAQLKGAKPSCTVPDQIFLTCLPSSSEKQRIYFELYFFFRWLLSSCRSNSNRCLTPVLVAITESAAKTADISIKQSRTSSYDHRSTHFSAQAGRVFRGPLDKSIYQWI